MQIRSKVAVAAAAAGLVAVGAGVAQAAWQQSGPGAGAGRATTLSPPLAANTSASAGATSVTVTVANAGPAAPSAPASGYRVDRVSPTAATAVCYITATTGSCSDAGLAPGSYSYNVFSVIGSNLGTPASRSVNWVSASSTSASAVVASTDSTPPTIVANCPTGGTNYALGNNGSTSWGAVCGSTIKVDATDSSGVSSVRFKLKQTTDNTCWNGSGWSSGNCTGGTGGDGYFSATAPTSGHTWTMPLAQNDLASVDANKAGTKNFTLSVLATDASSAHNATPAGSPVTVSFSTNN